MRQPQQSSHCDGVRGVEQRVHYPAGQGQLHQFGTMVSGDANARQGFQGGL